MSSRVRRISIALGLLLALGLVVGVGAGNRLAGDDDGRTTDAVATQPEFDPHPLAPGTTPANVQLAVYERAYSECATTEDALLASKYKAEDTSSAGVAAIVGRAWASYFKAGQDAVQDGTDGCLQGQADRSN